MKPGYHSEIPPPRCALCREPIGPKQPQVPWGRGRQRGVAHRECAEEKEREYRHHPEKVAEDWIGETREEFGF